MGFYLPVGLDKKPDLKYFYRNMIFSGWYPKDLTEYHHCYWQKTTAATVHLSKK